MKRLMGLMVGFVVLFGNASAFAAEDYLQNFIFSVRGSCSDKRHLDFRQAISDSLELGLNNQQKPLRVDVTLNLFPDGSFWAEYKEVSIENTLIVAGTTVYQIKDQFTKVVEGQWSRRGKILELPGLGVGEMPAMEELSRPNFDLTLKQQLNDPRANNRVLNVHRSFSNIGPKGKSINEYCAALGQ